MNLFFVPESIARYPGLVGQTVILGSVISSILVWNPMRKMRFFEEKIAQIEQRFNERFSLLFAVGIAAVLASNLAMLAVQTWRLDTIFLETIQTTFGNTWSVRMIITIALGIAWIVFHKIRLAPASRHVIVLVLSLMLIGTTTMMGHGAASEQIGAVILDYVHNLLSAVWIGGIIFLCFVLLPALSKLHIEKRDQTILALIPRYSTIIVLSLGILFVTGPTLLWFFESNLNSLTDSSYGLILISKIVLGVGMISIGGYKPIQNIQRW